MVELSQEDKDPVLEKKKEKKKKSKKDKKRKRKESADAEIKTIKEGVDDKETQKALRKKEREAKKKENEGWLDKVPKVDGDGISYTKIQIKRMLKRVKRGLPPVPTEEEERERLRSEAQMRREEEAELAGLVYKKEDRSGEKEKGSKNELTPEGNDDDDGEGHDSGKEDKETPEEKVQETAIPPTKKSKRSKPVPSDYICMACKTKAEHWIYDCPAKVTVRGTNQKAKKFRGLHEPDAKKLFISGLPFEIKVSDVTGLFSSCGKVVQCKLLKFGDTGRCNGQAYVSFDTDKAAEKALKLSGTVLDNDSLSSNKRKGKKPDSSIKRKELKLKVSKTMNRKATKGSYKKKS
jgi:hypothetical protein